MKVTALLLMCVLHISDARRKDFPLHLVIMTEKEYQMPKAIIIEGLNYANSHKKINISSIKTVMVEDGDKEKDVCRKIFEGDNEPTFMIDTIRRPYTWFGEKPKVIREVSWRMGLPTISTPYAFWFRLGWGLATDPEKEYLRELQHPGNKLPFAVTQICELQKLKSAAVLYDKEQIMDHRYGPLLQNLQTRLVLQEVEDNYEDVKQKILNMNPPEFPNFFVLGSVNIIQHALRAAEELKLYGRQFSWYFITRGLTVPTCNCTNITALFLSPKVEDSDKLATVLKRVNMTHQPELGEIVVKLFSTIMAEGNWPDTLSYPKCNDMSLTEEMKKQRSEIFLFRTLQEMMFHGIFGDYVLGIVLRKVSYQELTFNMKILQIIEGKSGRRNGEEIGTLMTCLTGDPSVTEYYEGRDLSEFKPAIIYRVTTVIQPPFVYKSNNSGEIVFTGYCIDMLNKIKDILRFEYTISETKDGKFGAKNERGEWNGMIRDLKDRKADIALGPISVMGERQTVVDFTIPYYELVGINILMKKEKVEYFLFTFLTVLENDVWGCILAAYFFTSFLIYSFGHLIQHSLRINPEISQQEDEKSNFTAKESLWFCMTSLSPQGGGEAPRHLSGKLTAATWWLFGFIIIAYYTANLAAFLTVSHLESTFESLDDLAKQHKVRYAPQKGTSSMAYFERMAHIEDKFYDIWKSLSLDCSLSDRERAKYAVWDYPLSDKYTKLWSSMKESDMPDSFEEGIERVRRSTSDNGFAFIADSTQVRYACLTNCDFISVGNEFSRKPLALAVQKGAPLRDELSSAILSLLKQKELERLDEKWWSGNPERVHCDDRTNSSGIHIIGAVFIIIMLSCLALMTEYCYYKHKRANTRTALFQRSIPPVYKSTKYATHNLKPLMYVQWEEL